MGNDSSRIGGPGPTPRPGSPIPPTGKGESQTVSQNALPKSDDSPRDMKQENTPQPGWIKSGMNAAKGLGASALGAASWIAGYGTDEASPDLVDRAVTEEDPSGFAENYDYYDDTYVPEGLKTAKSEVAPAPEEIVSKEEIPEPDENGEIWYDFDDDDDDLEIMPKIEKDNLTTSGKIESSKGEPVTDKSEVTKETEGIVQENEGLTKEQTEQEWNEEVMNERAQETLEKVVSEQKEVKIEDVAEEAEGVDNAREIYEKKLRELMGEEELPSLDERDVEDRTEEAPKGMIAGGVEIAKNAAFGVGSTLMWAIGMGEPSEEEYRAPAYDPSKEKEPDLEIDAANYDYYDPEVVPGKEREESLVGWVKETGEGFGNVLSVVKETVQGSAEMALKISTIIVKVMKAVPGQAMEVLGETEIAELAAWAKENPEAAKKLLKKELLDRVIKIYANPREETKKAVKEAGTYLGIGANETIKNVFKVVTKSVEKETGVEGLTDAAQKGLDNVLAKDETIGKVVSYGVDMAEKGFDKTVELLKPVAKYIEKITPEMLKGQIRKMADGVIEMGSKKVTEFTVKQLIKKRIKKKEAKKKLPKMGTREKIEYKTRKYATIIKIIARHGAQYLKDIATGGDEKEARMTLLTNFITDMFEVKFLKKERKEKPGEEISKKGKEEIRKKAEEYGVFASNMVQRGYTKEENKELTKVQIELITLTGAFVAYVLKVDIEKNELEYAKRVGKRIFNIDISKEKGFKEKFESREIKEGIGGTVVGVESKSTIEGESENLLSEESGTSE